MGEIITGISIPKTLNQNVDQALSTLKKSIIQQKVRIANSGMERTQSIFSKSQSDYTSTANTFFAQVFEKAVAEQAYKRLETDLSDLGLKSNAFSGAQNVSTNNIIKHENIFKENPEIKKLDNKIRANQVNIQEKEKALEEKTNSQNIYQKALNTKSFLTKAISQLQVSETSLITDIASIKTQIQQIKSGQISLSDLQINVTGSSSSSGIDTSKLISSDSSSAAILGGNQITETKSFKVDFSNITTQLSKKQEEMESQIKKAVIERLENLLSKKENQLTQTKQQIKTKQSELNKNDQIVSSYEKDNKNKTKEKTDLEKDLKKLIQENLDLIKERLEKDPALVKFNSLSSFINNFLQGSGDTGSGVNPDINRKKENISKVRANYENTSSKSDSYQEMLDIRAFLKNDAKSSLYNSKSKTEEEQNLFELFKQKYNS